MNTTINSIGKHVCSKSCFSSSANLPILTTYRRVHSRFFVTVYGIGVGRVDKGAGFCAVSTNDYRMNGGFAPLNPPYKACFSSSANLIILTTYRLVYKEGK
ncbi:MAG: hypothetical protein FJ264_08245 [Planctomycetes bacterium]|nr:hypothetical protein [Planctomycetota bacterium]